MPSVPIDRWLRRCGDRWRSAPEFANERLPARSPLLGWHPGNGLHNGGRKALPHRLAAGRIGISPPASEEGLAFPLRGGRSVGSAW